MDQCGSHGFEQESLFICLGWPSSGSVRKLRPLRPPLEGPSRCNQEPVRECLRQQGFVRNARTTQQATCKPCHLQAAVCPVLEVLGERKLQYVLQEEIDIAERDLPSDKVILVYSSLVSCETMPAEDFGCAKEQGWGTNDDGKQDHNHCESPTVTKLGCAVCSRRNEETDPHHHIGTHSRIDMRPETTVFDMCENASSHTLWPVHLPHSAPVIHKQSYLIANCVFVILILCRTRMRGIQKTTLFQIDYLYNLYIHREE